MGHRARCRASSSTGARCEGRDLLRRPRRPDGRGDPADPEADGPDRQPADPLAHHALLRRIGVTTTSSSASATRARSIKEYFLSYNGALSTTSCSTGRAGDASSSCCSRTSDEWRITFVDTGLQRDDRRAAEGGRAAISATTTSSSRPTVTASPTRRSRRRSTLPRERQDGDVPARCGRSSTRISS